MADRNLVLQLLISAKDEATSVFGKLFGYLDNNTRVVANKIREAFSGLFGGGATDAVAFEAQLDRVAAKGGYTAEAMGELAGKARAVGAEFGVSGPQAAEALENLAAAGLTSKEAIDALPSVLALATSEQISTAAAAEKLSDSLSVMGLGFDSVGRMADVLAQGANITTSSASQLAEALSEAGGTARAAGLDLESTVAALDLLHKNGIKGSEAGTALKSILTSLLDPASKASQELNALGITSRDLGTVIGQLKDKGTAANGAILAFGTEAGPGLRALLAEGEAALNNYTAQLQNADGAAQAAADAMGGNLKSALASLSSVWTSLKAALIEPLLAPIAQQARELASAFQGALRDGSIKGVQDLLREFGTGIADNIAKAIRSFDFAAATNAVKDFVESAKGSFAGVTAAATAAAGAIKVAWNAVTGPINLLMGSVAQTAGNLFETLATIERQAAKVGLGTVERADELLRKAQAARETAAELAKAARQDFNDLASGAIQAVTAFDGVGTAIDKAKTTAEDVKPPDFGNAATLEPIIRSLADLEGQFRRAKTAQEQAAQTAAIAAADYAQVRAEFEAGRASLYAYDEAKRKDAQAQAVLRAATESTAQSERDYTVAVQNSIRAIDTEAAAATAGVPIRQQLIDQQKQQAAEADKTSKAIEALGNAQTGAIRAELELARSKGDTAEVQRLARDLALAEIDAALRLAQVKAEQARIEAALAQALLEQAQKRAANNEITKEALRLAELEAGRAALVAEAAGLHVQALQNQKDAAEQLGPTFAAAGEDSENLGQQTRAAADAADQHTKATERQGAAIDKATGFSKLLADGLAAAREQTQALSSATGALFERLRVSAELMGDQADNAGLRRYAAQLGDTTDAHADLRKEIANMNAAIQDSERAFLEASNSIGRWIATLNKSLAEAKKSYFEQKLAAEEMADAMEQIGQRGGQSFSDLNQQIRTLEAQTRRSATEFNLLNEQDLNQLNSAIDGARKRLEAMRDATLDARDRLAELNAELLEAKGMDEKAARLRQELDYQNQLQELELQRAEAERTHNTELLALLEQQRQKIEEINVAKQRSLAEEARAQAAERAKTATTTATRSTASWGASTGGASTGGTTNTFNIHVDGKDLLSEDAVRNKVIPILQRTVRLSR